jgi:hypothetical protein
LDGVPTALAVAMHWICAQIRAPRPLLRVYRRHARVCGTRRRQDRSMGEGVGREHKFDTGEAEGNQDRCDHCENADPDQRGRGAGSTGRIRAGAPRRLGSCVAQI